MDRLTHTGLLLLVLSAGCFTDEPTLSGGDEGSSGTTTAASTGEPSADVSTDGGTTMAGGSGSEGPVPTSDGGGPCDVGQQCLPIPAGWQGPFAVESGTTSQCDDTSIAAAFVGVTAEFDDECSCNCNPAAPSECVVEYLVGGNPEACRDNDEVAERCTFALPGGPLSCDLTADGCFEPDGDFVTMQSQQLCTGGVGSEVTPAWTSGHRLCTALEAVGEACEGGQCADDASPLCIFVEGDEVAECPAAFPERIEGHQSFGEEQVACECRCVDPAECAYMTWFENGVCTGTEGDDDPVCSAPSGALQIVPFVEAGQGCQSAPLMADPPLPFADPITVCCTAAP
ncbi:MAG: hypothetical protein AAF799_07280 [Myxococcota bacterium]